MRFLRLFFLTVVFSLTSFQAHALDGIPEKMAVGGQTLVLNGAGSRTKFVVTVYNAGLYLQSKSSDANKIIAANEPMAIRMKIKSGFASAEKIKAALVNGFHNSTGGKTAPIQKEIDQLLNAAFTSKVSKGDKFDLVYSPNTGTRVLKNGKQTTVVKGLPIKKALFGIWLSNRPAQASLRSELLGQASGY